MLSLAQSHQTKPAGLKIDESYYPHNQRGSARQCASGGSCLRDIASAQRFLALMLCAEAAGTAGS